MASVPTTFNEAYYLQNNKDVMAAVGPGRMFATAYDHYVAFGEREGRKPNPAFDGQGYLNSNLDVWNAVNAKAFTSGLQHYEMFGAVENRAPGSAVFNEAYYLAQNTDVAANVGPGKMFSSGFQHYVLFGVTEGRAPASGATSGNPGQTFTLTTGADTVVGTANNDTINGYVDGVTATLSTLTAADSINGGAGTDTLNVTIGSGATTLPTANYASIETINVRPAGAALNASDLSSVAGLTSFNVDRATAAVTTTNLAKGGTYGVIGDNASTSAAAYALGYANAADVATLNISGGTKGTPAITLTGAGVTSTVINTTGTVANTVAAITAPGTSTSVTVNAASNLTGTLVAAAATKLTATGTATVDFSAAALNNTIVTVDASAMTAGGLKVAAGNSAAFKFTGGAGNDQVNTGAVLGTGLVDAAAGTTDRLVVTNTAHITAAAGALYKGFEQLQVQDGVTVDVTQLAANNTIDTIRINDAGAATGVTNLSAAQAAAVAITNAGVVGAITIGVKDASVGGQIDTVTAAMTTTTGAGAAQAMNLSGLTLAGVEKLVLNGTGTVAANTGAVTLDTTAATSLDSITFKNAADGNVITIAAAQTATNLNVDASSSTGGVTIDASLYNTTTGATLKGGSSVDIIEGTARGDTITGGAGNDVLSGTATVGQTAGTATVIGTIVTSVAASTAADTFTGGDGQDLFGIGTNNNLTNISSITDLNLGGANAVSKVDALVFDLATASAATVITLTDAQKSAVAAAADFAAAVNLVLAAAPGTNNVAQFVYGTDTYVAANGAVGDGTNYVAVTDLVVKVTGVTGTLDATDIAIL